MPIDIYDAAAWMVITPLSEQSIARQGAAVEIPTQRSTVGRSMENAEKHGYRGTVKQAFSLIRSC